MAAILFNGLILSSSRSIEIFVQKIQQWCERQNFLTYDGLS